MNWLCGVRWFVIASVYVFSVALAYGAGRVRENRRYWKMLQRAGSRTSGQG